MSNPLGKVVTENGGRRLVIGDIHGCLKTFKSLCDQVRLKESDQLFLLGDYVHKGPDSPGVIDYIRELSKNYDVHPLLGNHDLMVLDYLNGKDDPTKERLTELKGNLFFDLPEADEVRYRDFLSGLYHYFILDNYLLVHAGFDFTLANPFLGKDAMTQIREFYYDSSKAQGKTIIHGHYPYPLKYIRQQIKEHQKVIPLDNGCVYEDREDQGNLLCYNPDTDQLWIQPKID